MPDMTLVREGKCNKCNYPIRVYETVLIGGPKKGEKTEIEIRQTINGIEYGCRCEDIKLAQQAIQTHKGMKERKVRALFDRYSLINRDLMNATFDNYKPQNKSQAVAKRTAERYVEIFSKDNPNNLVFHGGYGIGKSHLAKSITDKIMEKECDETGGKYSAIYISVPKLLRKIRSTYNQGSDVTEEQILNVLETTDLLVLDDLGAENNSDWTEERLFDIIDSRQGLSTIYTMNYEPDDLMNVIGERNFSRVINHDTTIIEVEGNNHRLKNFIGG